MAAASDVRAQEIQRPELRGLGDLLDAAFPGVGCPGAAAETLVGNYSGRLVAVYDRVGPAMLLPFLDQPDGTAVIGKPVFHPRLAGRKPELLRAAVREVAKLGYYFTQIALEMTDPLAKILAEAGFAAGPVMLELAVFAPVEAGLPDGDWFFFSPGRRAVFAEAFYATLEGSLDCPELPVCRDGRRLMAAFEARGAHDAEDFALLDRDGRHAGIILLAESAGMLELVYLGVVPEARGRGLGRLLARYAIGRAAARRAPGVVVAVDRRNAPALALYRSMGFSEKRAVQVHYTDGKIF